MVRPAATEALAALAARVERLLPPRGVLVPVERGDAVEMAVQVVVLEEGVVALPMALLETSSLPPNTIQSMLSYSQLAHSAVLAALAVPHPPAVRPTVLPAWTARRGCSMSSNQPSRNIGTLPQIGFSALLLSFAAMTTACGRSEGDLSCTYVGCPCVFEDDCDEGYDCIDQVCTLREEPDAGLDASDLKGFGELCEANEECISGYCLPDLQGSFCTRPCAPACPDGWACRLVPDPTGAAEPIGLCVVDRERLCQPCLDDVSCNPSGGDLCLDIEGMKACGRDCTYEDCPDGYSCFRCDRRRGGDAAVYADQRHLRLRRVLSRTGARLPSAERAGCVQRSGGL